MEAKLQAATETSTRVDCGDTHSDYAKGPIGVSWALPARPHLRVNTTAVIQQGRLRQLCCGGRIHILKTLPGCQGSGTVRSEQYPHQSRPLTVLGVSRQSLH